MSHVQFPTWRCCLLLCERDRCNIAPQPAGRLSVIFICRQEGHKRKCTSWKWRESKERRHRLFQLPRKRNSTVILLMKRSMVLSCAFILLPLACFSSRQKQESNEAKAKAALCLLRLLLHALIQRRIILPRSLLPLPSCQCTQQHTERKQNTATSSQNEQDSKSKRQMTASSPAIINNIKYQNSELLYNKYKRYYNALGVWLPAFGEFRFAVFSSGWSVRAKRALAGPGCRGATGFSDVHLCQYFLSRVVPYQKRLSLVISEYLWRISVTRY